MISRTYVVTMPEEVPGAELDILVMNAPGTPAVPITPIGGGSYYEWRGRPLRIPVVAGASPPSAAAITAGFVPRTRLGISLSVVLLGGETAPIVPGTQLSESLALLNPAFPDPSGGPAIRMVGAVGTEGRQYLVSLLVMEAKDEDRDPNGI